MAEDTLCSHCCHWYPEGREALVNDAREGPEKYPFGYCRRYPPTPAVSSFSEHLVGLNRTETTGVSRAAFPGQDLNLDIHRFRQWPITLPTDRCGEFRRLDHVDEESLKARKVNLEDGNPG